MQNKMEAINRSEATSEGAKETTLGFGVGRVRHGIVDVEIFLVEGLDEAPIDKLI